MGVGAAQESGVRRLGAGEDEVTTSPRGAEVDGVEGEVEGEGEAEGLGVVSVAVLVEPFGGGPARKGTTHGRAFANGLKSFTAAPAARWPMGQEPSTFSSLGGGDHPGVGSGRQRERENVRQACSGT